MAKSPVFQMVECPMCHMQYELECGAGVSCEGPECREIIPDDKYGQLHLSPRFKNAVPHAGAPRYLGVTKAGRVVVSCDITDLTGKNIVVE